MVKLKTKSNQKPIWTHFAQCKAQIHLHDKDKSRLTVRSFLMMDNLLTLTTTTTMFAIRPEQHPNSVIERAAHHQSPTKLNQTVS